MGAKLAGAWGPPPLRMLLLLLPRAAGGRLPPGWGDDATCPYCSVLGALVWGEHTTPREM